MNTITVVCVTLTLLYFCKLYSNWRQLKHVPGPPLATLSDFWRASYQRKGALRGKLVELHKQYGPIVRYGVRSVSVNDPSVVDIVYGSRAGFVIADAYKPIVGISHGKEVYSLVTIPDEQRHNTLRRSIAGAFNSNTVLDYEPHIDRTIEELLKAIDKQAVFDLSRKMAYFGLDAAAGFAFKQSKACLSADADVGGMIAITRERMRHWSRWSSIPDVERLLYRNPIALQMRREGNMSIVAAAFSKLKERVEKPQETSEAPDLLTRFLEAMEKNPEVLDHRTVVGLLMSMISGASDTSANALTAIVFHLLKNPETLAKLLSELEAANINQPIPAFSQVNKLPYLHATIREGMRLFPALTHALERIVPAGGTEIVGTFLPQGTSVGCLQLAMHLNPKVFGEDVTTFRPERWLEASPEQLRAMEAAHMGFGKGRRVCIGQHIAMMEMKKVIPAMLMNYDIGLVDPDAHLNADFSLAVACPDALHVKMRRKA